MITATSEICNGCHMAFYNFTKSPGRLLTLEELLAAPAGKEPHQGIDRANITVARHMYETLATGNMVCSEYIAVVLARERCDNKVQDVSDKNLRVLVSAMMKAVGEGVSDVYVREYRGGTIGEDGRTTFAYLFPTNMNLDVLAFTDRKLRKTHRENQELRPQLQDARGNGGRSGSGSTTVTPRMHYERVEATNIGGVVVRQDILAARELRNVRRGLACQDDIERKLVPPLEYLRQLPESLRALMANVFSLDMGFRNDTPGEEKRRTYTTPRARSRNENDEKTDENRA